MKKQLLILLSLTIFNTASELDLGLGVGTLYYPDYLGSDSSSTLVFPYPYIDYRSKNLKIDKDGLKQQIFSIDSLSVRVSMSGSLPVKASKAREGMDELDLAGEIGPALVYSLYEDSGFSVKLDLPIRAVVSTDLEGIDYRGYIYELKAMIEYESEDGYLYQFHTGGVWGDSRYHNYIYGVEERFVTDDRDHYKAEAGYSGYKTSFGISKKFEKVWAGAFVRHYTLRGTIFEDSPLMRKDSAIYSGVFVAYLFDKEFSNKVKQWIE
ncbi:MipA/OmpV family protein [Sulfurovum sp. bin170]|uniref:MipA/OmpV family protein n=1 Tax=Sulfurovum sp. bin170 TaxID=2695268 RepID=UPI0013DFD896|nr:MipA/OmpV family protein [Sulfurovum sp. bin170]NEW60916.1 MipA/OmpV family protein [Sulfurovum sp. bin170]